MLDFESQTGGNRLPEIEKKFRCKIYLWASPSRQSKWECIRFAPHMSRETYDFAIDVVVDYTEGEISLFNAGLILGVDENFPIEVRLKRSRWKIFEALALFKNPRLEDSVEKLRSEVEDLEQKWNRKTVHISEAAEFHKLFKISLQVWCISSCGVNKIRRDKIFDRKGAPKLIGRFQNTYYKISPSFSNHYKRNT